MLIAGDVGGTHTRLAIYTLAEGARQPLYEAQYSSWEYDSLQDMVSEFLAGASAEHDVAASCAASCAVLGIPGPVVETADGARRATGTNLPWVVDEEEVRRNLDLEWVHLINDLEAIAWSVPLLGPEDLCTLNPGVEPEEHGAIAIIAPGTGLGEAYLLWDGEVYRPHPSEGGHADFAANGEEQLDLLRYLQQKHGHVSYERVCSGRGLPNIYAFLRDTGRAAEPAWLAERLADVEDPTPIIVEAALDRTSPAPICRRALELLVSILAAEAGNMALRLLATGGVFMAGGMPRHLLPLLQDESFLAAFRNKGRLDYMLEPIPVHVIVHPEPGRLGAAHRGLELLKDRATPCPGARSDE
jgi:glucokinase